MGGKNKMKLYRWRLVVCALGVLKRSVERKKKIFNIQM